MPCVVRFIEWYFGIRRDFDVPAVDFGPFVELTIVFGLLMEVVMVVEHSPLILCSVPSFWLVEACGGDG